jgi:hypothetical protein
MVKREQGDLKVAFLPADVIDLYPHQGAFETVLSETLYPFRAYCKLYRPTAGNSIAQEQESRRGKHTDGRAKKAANPLHRLIKADTHFDLLRRQICAILNIVTVKR